MFLGRVPLPGEPLWTDEDRDWAIALITYEADLCSGCGHSRTETTSADSEFAYTAQAIRCHACAAVARESERFTTPGASARGLLIGVNRRGDGC